MIYYKPEDAVSADIIPFYKSGVFYLFYLKDFRNIPQMGEGTPWYLLTTEDFLTFKEHGEVIPRGSIDMQDLYVFTGSVFEYNNEYYIFYTGHNPHFPKKKKPQQAIFMAKSKDLYTWQKVKDFVFYPTMDFEPNDWRDPFVFTNPENGKFGMLLTARKKLGGYYHRGCTIYAESTDLYKWNIINPDFFSPNKYYAHECPDLFKIGDWWYLIYSEFSNKVATRYVMSKSFNGPWISPKIDYFDNRVYYAAKSAADNANRYLFGWNATRENNSDDGSWQWGGNIIVHQIVQENDGTLSVKMPDIYSQYFNNLYISDLDIELLAENTYVHRRIGIQQNEMLLEAEICINKCQGEFGVLLRGDNSFDECYKVKFSPIHNRISLDRLPRNITNHPFMPETERFTEITPNKWYNLKVIVSGDILELYFGNAVAFSCRTYELSGNNNLGIFAENMTLLARSIKITYR